MNTIIIWIRGVIAAFIAGGASAVTATVAASYIAPDRFNTGNQLHNFLALAGATFVIQGAIGAFAYLSKSPLPDLPSEPAQSSKPVQSILPSQTSQK